MCIVFFAFSCDRKIFARVVHIGTFLERHLPRNRSGSDCGRTACKIQIFRLLRNELAAVTWPFHARIALGMLVNTTFRCVAAGRTLTQPLQRFSPALRGTRLRGQALHLAKPLKVLQTHYKLHLRAPGARSATGQSPKSKWTNCSRGLIWLELSAAPVGRSRQ
jgi:hypothetical protein